MFHLERSIIRDNGTLRWLAKGTSEILNELGWHILIISDFNTPLESWINLQNQGFHCNAINGRAIKYADNGEPTFEVNTKHMWPSNPDNSSFYPRFSIMLDPLVPLAPQNLFFFRFWFWDRFSSETMSWYVKFLSWPVRIFFRFRMVSIVFFLISLIFNIYQLN